MRMMIKAALAGALMLGGAAQAQEDVAKAALRPDVRAYLDQMKAQPRPAMTREMLAAIRKMPVAAMMSKLDLPVGELGTIKDVTMPGPGGPLRLRMYDPRTTRAPGPVMVFYHGGGFVVGGIETHAGLTADLARKLDMPVISVDYRLAPEHPWPAAPDDAEAAARWIAANGAAFGREITGIVLSGDSAGGNLTLVTALALRDKPAAKPLIFQLPLYPSSDSTKTYPSRTAFGKGFGLDSDGSKLMRSHYAADPKSVRFSPLLADLKGLPPTMLVTAAFDPLRDEGRAFAAELVEAGVTTAYYEVAGNIHGFLSYRAVIPSSQGDLDRIVAVAKPMIAAASAR